MGSFSRRFGCALALVFGLSLSSFSFAQAVGPFPLQSQAASACASFRSSWISWANNYYSSYPNYQGVCPSSADCSLSASRYSLTLSVKLGGSCLSQVPQSSVLSSNPYSSWTVGSGFVRFDFTAPDPDPEPTLCPAGLIRNDFKAPTPNGSGNVCLDNCAWEIALSPPPGPLYEALSLGRECTASDTTAVPVVDDNQPCSTPGDLNCPGTSEPDPSSPPNTGGGGFACDAPPSCNADGVTCSMLYQQWRTRCDAERNNLADAAQRDAIIDNLTNVNQNLSDLGDGVDRIGDGIDGVNTRLDGVNNRLDTANNHLDNINQNVSSVGSKVDRVGDILSDALVGDGVSDNWFDGLPVSSVNIDSSKFDTSGFGMPRTCPAILTTPISFSFFGTSYSLSFDMFCGLLDLVGQLLVVVAAFVGVRILLHSTTT